MVTFESLNKSGDVRKYYLLISHLQVVEGRFLARFF